MLALAAELGYAGPDPAGRALRSGRAGAIGVMFTEGLSYAFEDPAAIATLGGVAAEAERAATSLVLLPASFSSTGGPTAAAVRAAIVDAFFIISLPEDHPGVLAALERNVPVVIADTPAGRRRAVRRDRRPRRRASGRGAPDRAGPRRGSA